ncbi:hypothetical protein ACFQ0G_12300 [Streptomyces chiangmaiensis]
MSVFCGIDLVSDHHDVVLVDNTGSLLDKARTDDNANGLAHLLQILTEHGDTAEDPIPVAIETSPGLRRITGGARVVSRGCPVSADLSPVSNVWPVSLSVSDDPLWQNTPASGEAQPSLMSAEPAGCSRVALSLVFPVKFYCSRQ